MAAASSGDPGGSNGRRLPEYMDPTNKFGELTFLQLTGRDNAPLPKNPFLIGKSVEMAAGGSIEGANTEAQGTRYTLKVRNPAQVTKLLKMTKLFDGTEVVVQAHPSLNVSRCVISCVDIMQMEENEVLTGLLSQGVISVKRITRNEGGNKVNTPALILTFSKTTYPEYLKVGLLYIQTRPYYPNPMLCYGCFSYGHPRTRCPSPKRCFNCSNEHPETVECDQPAFCRNCKGNHRPASRNCPVYKFEIEVIKLKVRDNLTFPEARKRAEQSKRGTYAQATAQDNPVMQKLKELETTMKRKDEQIAKLLETAKKREDIQQLKKQITESAQEKVHPNREPKQTTQQGGPITRSRNNSPAFQENKRGRPVKQNPTTFNMPTTSQSPPPKKPTILTNETMQTFSNDEIEIAETPPNQHLR